MKSVLVITSVASMIDQFLFPALELLQNMDYEVHVACNFERGNTCSEERILELKRRLEQRNISHYQIDFAREVTRIAENLRAYKEVCKLVSEYKYDLIHCHSPIGGLITRIACRKSRKRGTKVIYTAHGFHFFKGSPIKNWLLYYPIEKICSYFTDTLITINHEDYDFASRRMKAKKVEYIPGVGIDLSKFDNVDVDRFKKRREIGVPDNAFLLISVGELNENKNHQVVIKAMAKLDDPNVHYVIVGIGNKKEHLLSLAKELGLSKQVHLLGYRKDIAELNCSSDVFCFPSFREGLSVALMEAMACGLPCVVSRIRGNTDLISEDGGALFDPCNEEMLSYELSRIVTRKLDDLGLQNKAKVQTFSSTNVEEQMKMIYKGIVL